MIVSSPKPSSIAPDEVQLRREWIKTVTLFVVVLDVLAAVGVWLTGSSAGAGYLGGWPWAVLFFLAGVLALPVIFVPFSARYPRWFKPLRRDLVLISGGLGVVSWAARAFALVISALPGGIVGDEWRALIGFSAYVGFGGLTWVVWTVGLGPWVGAHQRDAEHTLRRQLEHQRAAEEPGDRE